MDKTLKNISRLTAAEKIGKEEISLLLEVRLTEDKEASAAQGMKIYQMAPDNILSDYRKVELRIFDAGTQFFLVLYPEPSLPLRLNELKQTFGYKSFTAGNRQRKEQPGYLFEENGRQLAFFCDPALKQITMITLKGYLQP